MAPVAATSSPVEAQVVVPAEAQVAGLVAGLVEAQVAVPAEAQAQVVETTAAVEQSILPSLAALSPRFVTQWLM